MALISKIITAVEAGAIKQPFTTSDIKAWASKNKILTNKGEPYKEPSIGSILSNSAKKNSGSSNRNAKMLNSRINSQGIQEYWLSD